MLSFLIFTHSAQCSKFILPQPTLQETKICYAELPIIMYHSLLKSQSGKYTVTPNMFKSDLQYLKNHGYTSVFVNDVIKFCEGKGMLPSKPVIISFDDGHYNNYFYGLSILKELNFVANLNIIGASVEFSSTNGDSDNPNYSYVTWQEIKELHESRLFEIGNHTYNMHKYSPRFGVCKKQYEDDASYRKNLTLDAMRLEIKLQENCGFRTNIFAYPFGKYSKLSDAVLKDLGFKAFLTCNEGINKLENGKTEILSTLKRINRSGLISTADFFSKFKIK